MYIKTKSVIKKVIGEYTVARIKRIINRFLSNKEDVITKYSLKVIEDGYNTTCGYYDHNPIQKGVLLYSTTNKSMSKVINKCILLKNNMMIQKIESKLFSTQLGNRLIWIDNDRYIYNDFFEYGYISKEMVSGLSKVHPWPIYDSDGRIAVSIDFNRLGYLRPGYGYTKFPLIEISEDSIALSIYNISSDVLLYNITYGDIIKEIKIDIDLQKCYINHVKISPEGDKILFFFIIKEDAFHYCYLCVYHKGEIVVLEKNLSVSHYAWRDNNTILTTSYDNNRRCRYYMYDVCSKERKGIMNHLLNEDGHPTFLSKSIFITDTYPDKAGYQKIKIVNMDTQEYENLVEIYSTVKNMGVNRCDLHPRYDAQSKTVCFDGNVNGIRKVYILNVEEQRWIKEIGKEN